MKKTTTTKKASVATKAAKASTKSVKAKKASKPTASKKGTDNGKLIEKACKDALAKLQELNIDENLQSEMNWCLGSYRGDGNPAGLYQMAKRALAIFTYEQADASKGISAKLIAGIEKAIGKN